MGHPRGNLSRLSRQRVKGLGQAKLLLALLPHCGKKQDQCVEGEGAIVWKTVENCHPKNSDNSGEMAATEAVHGQEAKRRWGRGWVWMIHARKREVYELGVGGGDSFQEREGIWARGGRLVIHSKKDKEHELWVWVGGSFGNTVPFRERCAGSRLYCAA